MGAVLAGLGICIDHAVMAAQSDEQVHWWRLSLAVALVLPVGSFVYHQWFDPSEQTPQTYQFVVNGSDVDVIPLYGEAGGKPQTLATGEAGQNGLIGGETYSFDCWVEVGKDQRVWLRYHRFGGVWWAPRDQLHPPAGVRQSEMPRC
ncbi:hypothetical protein ABT052_02595 [Streptomyces sp. NPDC002766]|uniref:hypothetical protein n=1 Tax=Streptomyces sp. NPDC002766 TaxID=3154429 RepID=UPI003318CB5F